MTYGCHNREPFKAEMRTESIEVVWRDGTPSVAVVTRSWPNVFKQDCQYTLTDLGKTDPRCVGCKWRTE